MYRELMEESTCRRTTSRFWGAPATGCATTCPRTGFAVSGAAAIAAKANLVFVAADRPYNDVCLRATNHPEFDARRWNTYWAPDAVIEFKRDVLSARWASYLRALSWTRAVWPRRPRAPAAAADAHPASACRRDICFAAAQTRRDPSLNATDEQILRPSACPGPGPVKERPGMYPAPPTHPHLPGRSSANAADDWGGFCPQNRRHPALDGSLSVEDDGRGSGWPAPGRRRASGRAGCSPPARWRQFNKRRRRVCVFWRPARRGRVGDQCAVHPAGSGSQTRKRGLAAGVFWRRGDQPCASFGRLPVATPAAPACAVARTRAILKARVIPWPSWSACCAPGSVAARRGGDPHPGKADGQHGVRSWRTRRPEKLSG